MSGTYFYGKKKIGYQRSKECSETRKQMEELYI
jgi:hypothetical protein